MLKVWSLIFLVYLTGVYSFCPSSNINDACKCESNVITCSDSGITEDVLEKYFGSMSEHLTKEQKHFSGLTLQNTYVTELKENAFKDLTFDEIWISNNNKLTKIDSNAFNASNWRTKSIGFNNNNKELHQSVQSFFDILSKFVYIETINLDDNFIQEIPENAFKPLNGYQNNLTSIQFIRTSFKQIGKRAFYHLNALRHLDLIFNQIKNISEYAFEFEKPSKENLTINFSLNDYLEPSSFAANSLSLTRRPTTLRIGYRSTHPFAYLEKNAFLPFLTDNQKNLVILSAAFLDCDDCRNAWLKKYPKLELSCGFGKHINDPTSLINCN